MTKLLNIFLIIIGLGIFSSAQAISTPVPISPCNNKSVTSLVPELTWHSVTDAWLYEWELKGEAVAGGGTLAPQTSAIIYADKLKEKNSYQWRVRAQDKNYNWSSWSNFDLCTFNTNLAAPPVVPTTPGGPTIEGIKPNNGNAGALIKISGKNFSCDSYSTVQRTIIFTGDIAKPTTPTCESSSILVTTIPNFPSSVKSIGIQVKIGDKTSNSVPFSIIGSVIPSPGTPGVGLKKTQCQAQNVPLKIKNPKFYSATTKVGDVTTPTTIAYDGLVPCGKCVAVVTGTTVTNQEISGAAKYIDCQFCHFVIMFKGIVDFLTWAIIFPLGILMIVIGGLMFVFSAGEPTKVNQARSILTSVGIGLVIILVAWIAVSVFFTFIGLSTFGIELSGPSQWFKPKCDIII